MSQNCMQVPLWQVAPATQVSEEHESPVGVAPGVPHVPKLPPVYWHASPAAQPVCASISQLPCGVGPQMPTLLLAKPRLTQLQPKFVAVVSQKSVQMPWLGLLGSAFRHCEPATHCSELQSEPTGSVPAFPQNPRPVASASRHVFPDGQAL